jgi:hypothetical protein
MTKNEALKLALEALMYASYEDIEYDEACAAKVLAARDAIKEALTQPEQEPVAWADKQSLDQIANFDATIYAKGGFDNATPLYTTPPLPVQPKPDLTIVYQSGYYDGKKAALAKREWNFCEHCGKRTADLTTIHTCTPPRGKA